MNNGVLVSLAYCQLNDIIQDKLIGVLWYKDGPELRFGLFLLRIFVRIFFTFLDHDYVHWKFGLRA